MASISDKYISDIIADYAATYKFLDWIKIDILNIWILSKNTHDGAIDLLEKKSWYTIGWTCLSRNTNDRAIKLLEKNPDKIDWIWLSKNTSDRALQLL